MDKLFCESFWWVDRLLLERQKAQPQYLTHKITAFNLYLLTSVSRTDVNYGAAGDVGGPGEIQHHTHTIAEEALVQVPRGLQS